MVVVGPLKSSLGSVSCGKHARLRIPVCAVIAKGKIIGVVTASHLLEIVRTSST